MPVVKVNVCLLFGTQIKGITLHVELVLQYLYVIYCYSV